MKDCAAEALRGVTQRGPEFLHSFWDIKAQTTTCEGLLEANTYIVTSRGLV